MTVDKEKLRGAHQWIASKIAKLIDHVADAWGLKGKAAAKVRADLYHYAAKFCESMARQTKEDAHADNDQAKRSRSKSHPRRGRQGRAGHVDD